MNVSTWPPAVVRTSMRGNMSRLPLLLLFAIIVAAYLLVMGGGTYLVVRQRRASRPALIPSAA